MRAFFYTAFDARGRRSTGSIVADSETHASALLRDKGLFVADLKERAARTRSRALGWRTRMSADMRAVFTRQMAVLQGAGLTSEFALEAVRSAGGDPAVETLAARAKAALLDGQPLSAALDAAGAGFPPYFIASLRAGETSGDVGEVFAKLADHLDNAGTDRAQIATALVYPAFVAAVALLVCAILMTSVAPEIVSLFEGSSRELPPLTVAMLAVSDWLGTHWAPLAVAVAALVLLYLAALRVQRFRDLRDGVLLGLPLVGRLMRQGAAVQYLRTLALVLTSRHAILAGVDSAAGVLTVTRFRAEAAQVAEAVRAGVRLSDAMRRLSIVPPVVCQLMSAGEQSASLGRMTERGAILVENNLRTERRRVAALLEPMLMMMVGGLVLVIVLSVLLPIFDLQTVVTD